MMGEISGVDVIKSIRSDPSLDNIPIILFTAFYEHISDQDKVLEELKINLSLPKIIGRNELIYILDSLTNS